MKKKLGGVSFGFRMVSYDYNWRETIWCLSELCDEAVILDAGSDDGSVELLMDYAKQFDNIKVVLLPKSEWDAQDGQQKLAHFQNVALSHLSKEMDFYFCLQMDEILHQDSFAKVREVIELPYEGFLCRRYNMWGDHYHYLNVESSRKPVSDAVWRIGKTKYLSYGDGESIQLADPTNTLFANDIKIFHFGFVRSRKKQKQKMKHMMEEVFHWGEDSRMKDKESFDPWLFFNKEDCILIKGDLPKYVKKWVAEREHEYPKF